MNKQQYHKAGITFPEILFVLSIVLLIVSIAVPAHLTILNNRKSQTAYSQIKILLSASQQMNKEYRLWPSYKAQEKSDVLYGEDLSNVFVMNILSAVDGEGNTGHNSNPSQINFVEMVAGKQNILRFNDKGETIDPWGKPYQFVFDANYDNICSLPNLAQNYVLGTGVAVWSCGPDRKSDTKDDLMSWTR